LNNISFKIEKNSIIGIFGESGSGKSTILNLLTGLLKPTKGNISIDKFDLKDDKIKDLWQNIIGYIPQDNFLLDDTVKKNIIFSNKFEEVNQTNLDKAIYLAKIDKFISSLKDGIETKIGDRGINISGGQRQRIGIARALYNDPEVLIFDEATSSLDFETENEILDEIYAIKNKTIIMISHNLESLNRCQKILKLKDGIVSDLKFNQ
jgi:ABC-type bacteriocin/lantibiotic exporter with double-glycine peptidase domain